MTESSTTGKGRPTPKRSDRERRRGGPVAPPPQTRKEAAQRVRAQGKADRGRVRAGTKAGDERALTPRDSGPVRRLVRDLVDSRRNPCSFLLPAALLPLVGQLSGNRQVIAFCTTLWVGALVLALLDFATISVRIRKAVGEHFPQEGKLVGHAFYGLMRALNIRRFRLPKPQVAVGGEVRDPRS